jgi:hypothetical protein
MRGVGLPITDPVRNFAHMMAKELQEEEKQPRDATDTFTNVSKRLSGLKNLVLGIPKLQEKVKEIPGLRQQVEVTDLGGKVVAFRRQNRVRQLKDTWPIGICVYICQFAP